MKIRYEDDLKYEWQLDDSLNDITVPKLILQPLIENCFQHGFHQAGTEILPPWKIQIRSHHDKNRWYLSIANNGAPFQKEKLSNLRPQDCRLYFYRKSGYGSRVHFPTSRICLENTILRLHIYYHGEEYFHVSGNENEQTTVTIGGPLKPEKSFSRNSL